MSGAPILVPILLPESLLQTNRFHRSWIQAVEQYEDFGTEEVSSLYARLSLKAIDPTEQRKGRFL